MKTLLAITTTIALTGCAGTIDQKRSNYARVVDMAANPQVIEIHYKREGGNATFMERRCTGDLCGDMVEQRETVSIDNQDTEFTITDFSGE